MRLLVVGDMGIDRGCERATTSSDFYCSALCWSSCLIWSLIYYYLETFLGRLLVYEDCTDLVCLEILLRCTILLSSIKLMLVFVNWATASLYYLDFLSKKSTLFRKLEWVAFSASEEIFRFLGEPVTITESSSFAISSSDYSLSSPRMFRSHALTCN